MDILTFAARAKPHTRTHHLKRMAQLFVAAAAAAAMVVGLAGASPLSGQLIPIKSVPVASGNQFQIFPSSRPGMGGAGLAVNDSLGDPFRNPALGHRAPTAFFGAPVRYHISQNNGSGNTLPLGAHLQSGRTFGTVSFALQQVSAARDDGFFGVPFCQFCDVAQTVIQEPLSRSAARNVYLFGSLGREFNPGTSMGFGVGFADLGWVSGVEHLYAGSASIEPDGHTLDLRLGAHHTWDNGRELEAIVVHNRVDMRHDVTYVDFIFPPAPTEPPFEFLPPERIVTNERNFDRTNTWGLQTRYEVPVTDSPWRVATSATFNRKDHPKIPNYRIQNIPRDPGETWAFGLGFGAAREGANNTFAADVVYQPIWSNTWQEADAATESTAGHTIPIGGRTIDNEFMFSNLTLSMGVDQDWRMGDVQFGIEARSISYTLDQLDLVANTRRTEDESWIEWSPTASIGVALEGLELRYFGKLTTGSGLPGVDGGFEFDQSLPASGPDIIAAASGPLTLFDTNVWTHQFMVVIPFR